MDDNITLGVTILVLVLLFGFGVYAYIRFFSLAPEWAVWMVLGSVAFSFITAIVKD